MSDRDAQTRLNHVLRLILYWFERALMLACDLWFACLPRSRPSMEAMRNCRIVSHRGEHDNRQVRENTLAAFQPAAEAGCWGLEFDVRWTRDLQPVVMHDADAKRVFDRDIVIAECTLEQLQREIPEIPTLEEVLRRFGGRQHLMIELKRDDMGEIERRQNRLRELLAALTPAEDYHILALHPQLFELVEFAGPRAWLPVAELNLAAMSQFALSRGCDGICAQYLLLSRDLMARHRAVGQRIGSGFAASRFGLYREINRGVDWIFTNHALRLEAIRQQQIRSD